MAALTKAAEELLESAGATEIGHDYVIIGNTDVRILLTQRSILDLNHQARERNDD
jgi:hypothetical protein